MNSTVDERYLRSTAIIDSDHPEVLDQATKTAGDSRDPVEKAVKIITTCVTPSEEVWKGD
jgi:hypothetical protein